MSAVTSPAAADAAVLVAVVDVDVHPLGLAEAVADYIQEPLRSRFYRRHRAEIEARDFVYPPNGTTGHRRDANPLPGERTGLTMERQLLGEPGVDYAVLTPIATRSESLTRNSTGRSPRPRTACGPTPGYLATTIRDGIGARSRFPPPTRRALRGRSGCWAGHPRMIQVYMHPDSTIPFGRPAFDPLWAAATEAGFPVAVHPKKATGQGMLTPVGFSSYHMENFAQWPMQYMGHLASLVFEGTFERFPELRIVCLEAGFTWLAPFAWRLDRRWEALRAEVPHVKQAPSRHIAEHVAFSTQPIENINPKRQLAPMLDWIDASRTLMFSSDYPHYDFDSPAWLARRLPTRYRERIMAQTALELYGLPATRRRDEIDEWAADRLAVTDAVSVSSVELVRTVEQDAE